MTVIGNHFHIKSGSLGNRTVVIFFEFENFQACHSIMACILHYSLQFSIKYFIC